MKNKLPIIALFVVSLLAACTEQEKKTENKGQAQVEEKQVNVPNFDADSAYYFIKKQVSFGPRVPNTPEHRNTGEYLESKLKDLGLEVTVQDFQAKAYDGTRLNLKNIIGSINPDASKRILLAAHWDTRPFADQDEEGQNKPIDGANDGASGVGVLMEIARAIQTAQEKPDVGVDIIFFDGEDYGQPDFHMDQGRVEDSWCLGSQYWAKNKHEKGYSAYYGILLDMVGAKDAKFAMEGTSMHFAPSVVKKVWQTGHRKGFGHHFIGQKTPPITDDHVYVNQVAGIPMIDIIEYNTSGDNYFGDYWHTHEDNMDVIDPATLEAVGETVLEVLYRE